MGLNTSLRWIVIISLLITSILFEAQAVADDSPREIASRFYTLVVREKPGGLPDTTEMKLFEPFLSQSLSSLFSRARKVKEEAMRDHPGDKPPYVDGCLFSCLFEGPERFRLGAHRISGRFAYLEVWQSAESEGDYEWADELVLVMENGHWLVWDIRMGCTWPFRMGPTLRKMLNGD